MIELVWQVLSDPVPRLLGLKKTTVRSSARGGVISASRRGTRRCCCKLPVCRYLEKVVFCRSLDTAVSICGRLETRVCALSRKLIAVCVAAFFTTAAYHPPVSSRVLYQDLRGAGETTFTCMYASLSLICAWHTRCILDRGP